MMIIRHAIEQDAPALVSLLVQLGQHYTRTPEEIQDRIHAFQREHHQLLVAEENGSVIGVIAFGCYEQFRLQGCCCHIDALIIDSKHRGKGVGKRLLKMCEDYAISKGATEIELTSANHRIKDGTHAFYQSLGYQNQEEIDCAYFVKQNSNPLLTKTHHG